MGISFGDLINPVNPGGLIGGGGAGDPKNPDNAVLQTLGKASSQRPKPIDYKGLINEQANVNRVNVSNPYGSSAWNKDKTQLSNKFSPQLQQLFKKQTGMAGDSIGNAALKRRQNNLATSSAIAPGLRSAQENLAMGPGVDPSLRQQQTSLSGSPVVSQDVKNRQLGMALNPSVDSGLLNRQRDLAFSPVGNQNLIDRQMSMTGGPMVDPSVRNRQNSLALNPENFNQDIEQATFKRAMNLMEPGFQQQSRRFEQEMANRGLPVGGEAYDDQFQNIQRAQNSARENAALSAVLAGNEAALRSRGQNFDELNSLASQDFTQRGRAFDELSSLQGQDLARRNQGFGEMSSLVGQEMTRGGQEFGRLGSLAGQQLDERGQRFGELSSLAGQDMTQRNQDFGRMGALAGQDMAARGQQFGQMESVMNRDLSQRGQRFNELASILGQTPVSQQSGVDVIGPANMAMNNSLAQQQQQANQKSSATNAGASLGAAYLMSDRRAKENIVVVGEFMPGIHIHEFNYKGQEDKHIGFMADEVEKIFPEAVITRDDGYKMVNYGYLLNE